MVGYAGGIVVAWKEEFLTVELITKKFQFIHLKMRLEKEREWYFTPVYASPNEDNRRILWEELKVIADNMNQPWLLAGDFNDITSYHEKKGGGSCL